MVMMKRCPITFSSPEHLRWGCSSGLWHEMKLNKLTHLETLEVHSKLMASSAGERSHKCSLEEMLSSSIKTLKIFGLKGSEICASEDEEMSYYTWDRLLWAID
jgi:hypothetical protein